MHCIIAKFDLFLNADPFMMPHMRADKGAIKFILSGANIMCPGLTSPGAKMSNVDAETVVVSSFCQTPN